MAVTLRSLRAVPLAASFAAIYGGEDRIPPEIRNPASHFQSIPRVGQYATLVIAESSDGATGLGECFGLPTPHAAAAMVDRVVAPALVGRPLAAPAEMLAHVRRYLLALGHGMGPGMEALSGVDVALWDLDARRAGLPLAERLGGAVAPVATYASPIPFLETPRHSAEAAARLARDLPGGVGLKLKIGRGTARDVPHIEAVREAIRLGRALMLDANCGYDPDDALALVDALDGLGIAWLEEPLPPGDLAGARRLAKRTEIPLAGGENAFTSEAMTALIETAGVRVLQPNVSRAGGVSGLLEIDAIAARHGVEVAPHGVGGSIVVAATLHCAPVMRAFATFEMNRLPDPLRDEMGAAPSLDAGGRATPARAEGHGVTLALSDIERFSRAV